MTQTPVSNEKLSDEVFLSERGSLLRDGPITEPIDLDECFNFHLTNLVSRNCATVLAAAKRERRTLVQPRAGVATVEGHLNTLQTLQDSGADILPTTVDSFTRNLRFQDAADALARSSVTESKLNGYPIVAHGVYTTRKLVLQLERPVHLRANSVDLRLVAEVALASGMTGFVSGPMYSTMEYAKTARIDDSIRNWQYIFRLIGKYSEAGIPIVEDALGFSQSGSYSVPSLMHVGVVLDALIMAAQGVKHILTYAMAQGALAQDVAACLAVGTLTDEYLKAAGYDDVNTYVACNHWNGAFPPDEASAYGLISANTLVAGLARASLVYVKSIEEAVGVPTAEGNAASVRTTRYILHLVQGQHFEKGWSEVEAEIELNLLEARAILDAVLHLGDGDPAMGSVRAFETGVLDLPFSPNVHVKGDVLVARDDRGSVRFLDGGKLPLPGQALRMEKECLARRATAKGRSLGYQDILEDVDFLSAT